MKVHKIDHISINVRDIVSAKAFFLELGLEVQGETEMEGGEWLDKLIGLHNVKTKVIFLRTTDAELSIELVQYYSPLSEETVQASQANLLGIRHIAFVVDDVEALVAKMKNHGAEPLGTIYNYENTYKLCYIRGPEGIILELAEPLK